MVSSKKLCRKCGCTYFEENMVVIFKEDPKEFTNIKQQKEITDYVHVCFSCFKKRTYEIVEFYKKKILDLESEIETLKKEKELVCQ